MAEQRFGDEIEPEVAGQLAGHMGEAPGPKLKHVELPVVPQGQQWPDGNGKRRHPRDNNSAPGRMGHEAAVTAVHRTARPDVPHSS